jgi:UDP-N-acetylglucosamine 1-carboxyvinyltransferase
MSIVVFGGSHLEGSVRISGSKNAALPILAASLLVDKPVFLSNVPDVGDVRVLLSIMAQLGSQAAWTTHSTLELCTPSLRATTADAHLLAQLRAGFWVIGPLLARAGEARIGLPGGCGIGARPIDLHLYALRQLGAKIVFTSGAVHGRLGENGFVGNEIAFPSVSVGATHTAVMAATCASGETTIFNAATEPEVGDLINFLNGRGASILGAGSSTLTVKGTKLLSGGNHRIIPDRIETGTYAVAVAQTGGHIRLNGACLDTLNNLTGLMLAIGVSIKQVNEEFVVSQDERGVSASDIKTGPYPGFPTDLQPQFMAMMANSRGTSRIEETIFENRFQHVAELLKMGAKIEIKNRVATVTGVPSLIAACVNGTDLRATAALIIAGLTAKGRTEIAGLRHLDRGYVGFVENLARCGAKIHRASHLSTRVKRLEPSEQLNGT